MMRARNGARARAARGMIVVAAAVAAATSAAGCLQILGDEGPFVLGTGGGGATGGSGGTGATGGNGGTGGSAAPCEPGKVEACYEGTDGTQDVGVCKAGMWTCQPDSTWGTCAGQVVPGVETCVSKDDEDCDQKECARWSLISGGNGGTLGTALATDSNGNVILSGIFGGNVSFGDKVLDETTAGPLFLAKLDAAGTPQWAKSFGGFDLQQGVARSIAADADGNILMAGLFTGTLSVVGFSHTSKGQDFFAAKFTSSGTPAWVFAYGGEMDQEPWKMVLTSGGDMLVTGTYSDGFLIGGTSATGAGVFIARLSASDGSVVSVQHFDTLVGKYVSPSLAAGPDGTWALAGRCSDGALIGGEPLSLCDQFVAKFAADDSLLWAVNVPAEPKSLVAGSDGAIVLGGDFYGTVDFGDGPLMSKGQSDLFVAKLATSDGITEWAKAFGGSLDEYYPQLALDSQDRIYFTVDTDDDIDFGGGTLSGSGLADTYVVALDAGGNHRWSRVFGDATNQSGSLLTASGGDVGLVVALTTPGAIDFGAGGLQSTSPFALAIAELGP